MVILAYIGFGIIIFTYIILLVCTILEMCLDRDTPFDKIVIVIIGLLILDIILFIIIGIWAFFMEVLK